jgi:DHA1 family multidrug resistance protein-like MFS transporter
MAKVSYNSCTYIHTTLPSSQILFLFFNLQQPGHRRPHYPTTMVADLIRDSPFGHIVRLVTRNKVFQYPEERDPNLWKKYVNQEKSGYMAHHGTAEAPEEESDELNNARGIREREASDDDERTQVGGDDGRNEASGVKIDAEKGKDKHVIDWYGENDPQVRLFP